jgi:hypothetical protein
MDRLEAKKEPRSEGTAKKREDCPAFTAGPWLGQSESQRRKEDGQGPENKKTVAKQAFHPTRCCGNFKLMLHRPHIYILPDARRHVPRFNPDRQTLVPETPHCGRHGTGSAIQKSQQNRQRIDSLRALPFGQWPSQTPIQDVVSVPAQKFVAGSS